jgi:hypothetical protein
LILSPSDAFPNAAPKTAHLRSSEVQGASTVGYVSLTL